MGETVRLALSDVEFLGEIPDVVFAVLSCQPPKDESCACSRPAREFHHLLSRKSTLARVLLPQRGEDG